jgi:diguanylate cyclase (GGDEF)-like protein
MSSDAPPIGEGFRVIVVDDEPGICRLLDSVLSDLGFQVELFGSATDARDRFTRDPFDIVVIDKNLHDGNGFALCTELQAVDADCQIVLMSGYANLPSAVDALRHGVADYWIKPLVAVELRGRLERVLDRLRVERGHRRLVAELQQKNAELEALAVRDPLTRLFNHGYLQEALQREVARSERYGHSFALGLLDLDRFKDTNERYGHATGDRILREVAALIRTRSRRSDLPFRLAEQEVAARYGADVFALILPETTRGSAATKLESVRRSVHALTLGDGLPRATLSIGFATYPEDGSDRESLVRSAQRALTAAKRVGGDQLVSYTPALDESGAEAAAQAAAKAAALGRSLAEAAFRFVYQPIVAVRDAKLIGYEALCRPTDAAFANVGELLETAVRTGRIGDLGRVLRKLVVEPMPSLPEPHLLFVNIHPQDLNEDDFLELEPYLKPWAKRMVLEVTETEAIRDATRARMQIQHLRATGLRVALDDLGSGYSSLNLLAQLEPDFVKLDMQLVRGIERAGRTARLIHHLLEFCRGEGFTTIAEGIETEAELQVVSELGVDYVQGFLLGQPSPPFVSIERPSSQP